MPLRSTRSNLDYLKRYILDETFDEYRASRISRRDMLRRVLVITGSIPLTASLVSACTTATPAAPPTGAPKTAGSPALAPTATSAPKAAASPSPATRTTAPSPSPAARTAPGPSPGPAAAGALTVAPNDPAIEVRTVEFAGPGGTLKGYLAQPRGVRQAPGILVIHENRGLDEHHQDVARRYAKDGFVALAVDLLSRRGGSDRIDPAQATGTLGSLNQNDLVQDLVAYADYLKNLSVVAGPKVGAGAINRAPTTATAGVWFGRSRSTARTSARPCPTTARCPNRSRTSRRSAARSSPSTPKTIGGSTPG